MNNAATLLQRAQEAVNRGDVLGMLEALTASGYLDGLTRRLQKKWSGSLPWSVVDDCIAQSVDAACAAASQGRSIRSLGAWLWKSADKIAHDRWKFDHARRVRFRDDTLAADSDGIETDREREGRQELEEVRHNKAIRMARDLLPRIGDGQVRDVMELVIDAAEDRLPDLPASSIADALGISDNAARALVSRGLKRLSRLAAKEGVEVPTALPETDTDEDEDEDEEEHDDAR